MNQGLVAGLKPPHLAAICPWEGYADRYRDATHHGGIVCTFSKNWQEMQVTTVQHGVGERGPRSPVTGELVCGPVTLSEEALARNRVPFWADIVSRPLDGDYYRARSSYSDTVDIPLMPAETWGRDGMQSMGTVKGYDQTEGSSAED